MCGIAGFLGMSEPPLARQATLGAMLATLTHRGPDDEGTWHDEKVGLGIGMRRLSIVDLAGGHQPIWNEDHSVGIVFNGEIYNHVALRRALEQSGHVFCTRSDTEVLVHLYEERGTKLFERLQGMYGLAIVDLKRQQILLARDPFGQKPLYLFRPRTGMIAFASEPKALRVMRCWHGSIDDQSYFDYLTWHSLPAPRTHWQQVEKLAAGEWQVISLRDATLQARGFTPAIKFDPQGDLKSPEAAAPQLEAALRDSVQRHLEADVPVGLLLSGGSDSLAIGWTVSQIAPPPSTRSPPASRARITSMNQHDEPPNWLAASTTRSHSRAIRWRKTSTH